MTETQFTSKLIKELRQCLPGSFIMKHADGYSAGIPDISISSGRDTLWLEAKLTSNPKIFEPLQFAILEKLHGHYIIWDTKSRRGCKFHAYKIFERSEVQERCVLDFHELVQNILNEVR